MSDSNGVKLLLTGIVIVMAIPGLVIEPGPLSEMAALGAIFAIWGIDADAKGGA